MVSCSVPYCSVTGPKNQTKYSFHRFPKDPDLRRKWLRAINRKTWTPHKTSVVCGKHFATNCFKMTKLEIGSIPTLFVPVEVTQRMPTSYIHRNTSAPGTSRSKKLKEKTEKKMLKGLRARRKVNTDDTEPGPSKRTRRDSNSSTNLDSNEKNIEQCRFCAEYSKDCVDTCYIPFLMEDKASIIFNDFSVNLDFTDNNLPQAVCPDCNSKLQEIINFIRQVTEAQKKFKVKAKNNRRVYEFKNEAIEKEKTCMKNKQTKKDDITRDTIEKETITRNDDDEDTRDAFEHRDIKVEYESLTEEDNVIVRDAPKIKIEPDVKKEMTDSLPAEEPVFTEFKRKNEDTAIMKKAKVICVEEVTFDMDIKEEVTNDANEDYPEVQYDSERATTGIGTTVTTTENVTTGTADSTGIGVSSALASVKYITIDGKTGRFSVESGNKQKETQSEH